MARVGIPQALLYYQYYPMWRTFFEHLGAEVVVSPPTSKQVVSSGSARMVAETCLPTKVFCGHVISLVDRCDCVFVPAIRSIERNVYNCSKFLGLPDLVKAVVPRCPPLLDVDIDVNKGKRTLYASVYRLGRYFTWNPVKVKEASEAAWRAHLDYVALMSRDALTIPQAVEHLFHGNGHSSDEGISHDLTIAVIGHPYIIYDEYVNHRLLRRLQSMGVRVATAEMAAVEGLDEGVKKLVGRPYWTYEDEVVGAAGYYFDAPVDGIITVVPFGCGPDSIMTDVVQRYAKRNHTKPVMTLTIDEHTAEAGLITRLEAFLDMIRRRRRLGCE
ncbi:MAG: acyl-CoA dehydratase activase-related protein [Chloroflexota bacterium]